MSVGSAPIRQAGDAPNPNFLYVYVALVHDWPGSVLRLVIMFKLLRKVLIFLLVVIAGLVGWHFLGNPVYQRELVQKAEEVKENLGDSQKKPAWTGTVVVKDAVKGDKVVVDMETSHRVVVRLAALDAPELRGNYAHPGQPLAEESRDYLANLVKNKAVEMAIVGTDAAKTPLALLTLDGVLINAKVAGSGMAEVTTESIEKIPAKLRHEIENAELSAKQAHLGVWGLTNYVRPVEYRIRHP